MAEKVYDKICEDCESNFGYVGFNQIECVSEEACLMGSAYKKRAEYEKPLDNAFTNAAYTELCATCTSCYDYVNNQEVECVSEECVDGCMYEARLDSEERVYISDDPYKMISKKELDDLMTSKPLKDSGERTDFGTGAVRDMHAGKGRCDLLPPAALLRLARHFENGALKYGERNWELGIPCHSFADSGHRHLLNYMNGDTDEDHLAAAIWNLVCLAETEEKRPYMMDIPSRINGVVQDQPDEMTPEQIKASYSMANVKRVLDAYDRKAIPTSITKPKKDAFGTSVESVYLLQKLNDVKFCEDMEFWKESKKITVELSAEELAIINKALDENPKTKDYNGSRIELTSEQIDMLDKYDREHSMFPKRAMKESLHGADIDGDTCDEPQDIQLSASELALVNFYRNREEK